jgi:hypothetical protein
MENLSINDIDTILPPSTNSNTTPYAYYNKFYDYLIDVPITFSASGWTIVEQEKRLFHYGMLDNQPTH